MVPPAAADRGSRRLDRPSDDPARVAAHADVLADPGTQALLGRLPDRLTDNHLSAHASPGFVPNLLNLLADLGVGAGDDARIEHLLDAFCDHQDASGRFMSCGTGAESSTLVWGALLCDTHAVTEVLVRYGRAQDPAVTRSLRRTVADLAPTRQGVAWPCLPDALTGFRGPGRTSDFCPQVKLEALRAWRVRADEKPYMFGHGRQFKTIKWPTFWYDVHWLLDTVGRYPRLWRGPEADPADRLSMAELAAVLVAYNVDADGTVTPRSCYRGFADHSFGQKKHPSGFATARLAAVLRRVDDLADDARAVDVLSLGSSKGGTGHPMPPRPLPVRAS